VNDQVGSALILVLDTAAIAALIGALVWWFTHRGRRKEDRDSAGQTHGDNLDEP
jgi:hypothetical protein